MCSTVSDISILTKGHLVAKKMTYFFLKGLVLKTSTFLKWVNNQLECFECHFNVLSGFRIIHGFGGQQK